LLGAVLGEENQVATGQFLEAGLEAIEIVILKKRLEDQVSANMD
tara:strand:+ start:139 stop:270 length:132 start_codon:yes stop_codon:yes gene_type:complete